MSDKPLVSIVTPCYNGAPFVDRYIETVMEQTYPNIELIFVDDGSTDDSLAKAEAWRARLEGRGISYKLLTQPNRGLPGAINCGLPEVTGKYLSWFDVDDLMDPRNIEVKTAYLESHPEKVIVACDVAVVLEDDLDTVVTHAIFDDANPRIFDGLIREKPGYFCFPLPYLVRSEVLFSAIGGRHIYDKSPSGQDWQLLFPLTYHYDCGFIHEDLATYVIRRNSHSRSYSTLEDRMRRTYELQDIIDHVLPTVGMSDEDYRVYSEYARLKYLPTRFTLAVKMGDKAAAREYKRVLDEAEGRSHKRDFLMLVCGAGLGHAGYLVGRSVKKGLRSVRDLLSGRK